MEFIIYCPFCHHHFKQQLSDARLETSQLLPIRFELQLSPAPDDASISLIN